MSWKQMLAYVTGEIEESLLLQNEYLLEENRALRNQLKRPINPLWREIIETYHSGIYEALSCRTKSSGHRERHPLP